jgi:L-arabinokinase
VTDDLTAFIEELRATEFFEEGARLVLSRAPGRLDVMGGIADYSGSLVLQRTTAEATFAAIQRTQSSQIEIVSLAADPASARREFALPLSSLSRDGMPLGYDEARAFFSADEDHWAAYVIGAFAVLMRERSVQFSEGCRILISSSVPEAKGVASSAALEVAVMQAVAAAFEIRVPPTDMALLCQMVENHVAGAPCGVMDQMTSVCGASDALLALVCQPATLQPPVRVPEAIAFWGLDSGERHAVSGSDYTAVRAAAFMGLQMLTAGHGHLANIRPGEFEEKFLPLLPEQISGAAFLSRYSATRDTVAAVDPARTYKVRQAAAHAVYENSRVAEFRQLLLATDQVWDQSSFPALGSLMLQSHESYSACGLGSPGTDRLVRLVREAGPAQGLFGARITGGGSGGTVAIVGREDAGSAVTAIARQYQAETGHRPYVFSGSSPGAAQFGVRNLTV